MFVDSTTRRIELPHEDGEWVEVRMLSWRELREARQKRLDDTLDVAKKMGTDLRKEIREAREDADVKEAMGDPLNDYDLETLLGYGIVKWSYERDVNAGNIGLLDEKTVRVVASELVPDAEEEGKDSAA